MCFVFHRVSPAVPRGAMEGTAPSWWNAVVTTCVRFVSTALSRKLQNPRESNVTHEAATSNDRRGWLFPLFSVVGLSGRKDGSARCCTKERHDISLRSDENERKRMAAVHQGLVVSVLVLRCCVVGQVALSWMQALSSFLRCKVSNVDSLFGLCKGGLTYAN